MKWSLHGPYEIRWAVGLFRKSKEDCQMKTKIGNERRVLLRPIYIIEREMREAMDEAASYLRNGHYARYQQCMQKVVRLKDEYETAQQDIKFDFDNKNMEKAERSFFSKILNLSLNEADLAVYHVDMFFAYMKERDFVPVSEWDRRKRNLKNAIKEYREFISSFFYTIDLQNASNENLIIIHDIIRDKVFTDREKVYYDKYEEKAGG